MEKEKIYIYIYKKQRELTARGGDAVCNECLSVAKKRKAQISQYRLLGFKRVTVEKARGGERFVKIVKRCTSN